MFKSIRFAAGAAAAILLTCGAQPLSAQAVAPSGGSANVATAPDVLAAERLFSAWMEGQIAYRGLPGVAVGVVSDQQLVWSKGFGYADIKAKRPMTPATRFRMASNSKLFTAVAIMHTRPASPG